MEIVENLIKVREHEAKEKLVEGAFIGWQFQEQIKGLTGSKKAQPFPAYLKEIGLEQDENKGKKEPKVSKEEAFKIAQSIIELDTQK